MREVISKIWKIYESVTKIGLIVDKENLPAIKLYQKLHFKKIKNTFFFRLIFLFFPKNLSKFLNNHKMTFLSLKVPEYN